METAVSAPAPTAFARVFTGWIESAQPLLGTLVRIGVRGLAAVSAEAALERAFSRVGQLDALLSFHAPGSDVSRLNRVAPTQPVVVASDTLNVLRQAAAVSASSGGLFDITIAPTLVAWGYLPRPLDAPLPDPTACWRDILLDTDSVRFRRPLWLDLGGIAKGYAVDAALQALELPAGVQGYVDAGGDLRVAGPDAQRVVLDAPGQAQDALPVVELRNGALASSSGFALRRWRDGRWVGPHIHGSTAVADRFASVVAPDCTMADALTKVVLAAGANAASVLQQFGATAHLYSHEAGWLTIGGDL